jgi:hypothetical protein
MSLRAREMRSEEAILVMQMLKNIGTWLDKAEKHAAAKRFDVNTLMTDRLAPDMKPFIYQVKSACDYVKAAAAWLSGQMPPKHEDNERTIDDARPHPEDCRFRREREYAGASDRKVSLLGRPASTSAGKTTSCRWQSRTSTSTWRLRTPSSATMGSTSARWIFSDLLIGSMPDPLCRRCSTLLA